MSQFKIIGTPLYQWEIGRKLKVIPLCGMSIDSVHISNYGDATALVIKPKQENGEYIVDIPNILLQDDQNIVVYSVNVSEDKTETIRECVFPVHKRAKPSDYIYTETDVFTYKALEERVKKLEEESTVPAVRYELQSLSNIQKEQARTNIDAMSKNGDPTAPVTFAEVVVRNHLELHSKKTQSIYLKNDTAEGDTMTVTFESEDGPESGPVILHNIAEPEHSTDATPKAYVERMIAEALGGVENGSY